MNARSAWLAWRGAGTLGADSLVPGSVPAGLPGAGVTGSACWAKAGAASSIGRSTTAHRRFILNLLCCSSVASQREHVGHQRVLLVLCQPQPKHQVEELHRVGER